MVTPKEKIARLSFGKADTDGMELCELWKLEEDLKLCWMWALKGRDPQYCPWIRLTYDEPAYAPTDGMSRMFVGHNTRKMPRRMILQAMLSPFVTDDDDWAGGNKPRWDNEYNHAVIIGGVEELVDRVLGGEDAEDVIPDNKWFQYVKYGTV